MEEQDQGTSDQVLALKQFLQGMLLTDQENMFEPELPVPGKGVIRNDRLLELMGVPTSEASSSAGCSAYSLDDEQTAPVEFFSDEEYVIEGSPPHEGCFSRKHMNKTSEELLRRSATFEPDFQTRMKQFLIKNQQKKERIRQSLVVQEDPPIVPMPRINQRSKSIPRSVSHLIAWNHDKESKLSRMRDAESAKQEAACVGKPSISKRSVSIFSKRQDDVALCKVEDRLHLLGLIYQYQQEERKRAEERQASSNVQPQLAPHSANAQRRRRYSVHERLYQLSKRNMAKDNNDHEHYSSSPASQRRRVRGVNVENIAHTVQRLHGLSKQYQQKQLLRSEERKQYFETLRAMPKMGARSRKLAAKKKKNPAPKSPLRCGCCGGKEDKEGKCGCTVEPRVNQQHAADIYERQLRWKNANNARHCQQKQLQETLAMTECTFRNPYYRKAWNTLGDPLTQLSEKEARSKEDNAAFFKRSMVWADKRDRAVAREKKASQERQLEECTFKPRLTARTPSYLLAARHRESNQQLDEVSSSSSRFLDCSTGSSPERRASATEELLLQLYSALDLQALAGELSPEHHSIGSDDNGAHGFLKYSFTDLGEFAGR
ncbi:chromosome transmission fidelity protein [Phytophthora cinnamomi]|uniref:chromosome transmission fidelity protein n=1 Tax=Phytophthora cinnamomi TaxID=4785 RepID=UPI00355965C5|nr:chromosome transmission fidelity protein [Phytophthora cinnamomi]